MLSIKNQQRFLFLTMIFLLTVVSLMPARRVSAIAYHPLTPILRIQAGSIPSLLDPQQTSFVSEVGHVKLIYEGLTRQDTELEVAPGAAESWVISSNGLQVTFNIRENLKYSDGTILNAKRFEYSILRALDPRLGAPYASILDMISGANEYLNADPNLPTDQLNALRAAVGVHALDTNNHSCVSYTQLDCLILQVNLTVPYQSFLSVMSLWVVYPAKEELIISGGANWWSDPSKQIGNGSFLLSSFNTNGHSLFLPNENYWRGAPSYTIDFRYTSDANTAFDLYKNGLLDIVTITPQQLPEVQADPILSSELYSYPGSCTFAILFHNGKAPFNDPKVRAAFAYAFNRQAWVEQVLGGFGIPTLTWIPMGVPGYDDSETRWAYDQGKALQAISESSYGSAANLPQITLTYSNTQRNQTRNEWLANQWHSVFNIPINLNPVDPTIYTILTQNIETAPQTYILGWCGDYPDPSNYLSVYWHSATTFAERIGYANPQLDSLLDQADAEQNAETRAQLFEDAQRMLIGDVPGAMGWFDRKIFLVKSHVRGAIGTPFDTLWMGDIDPMTITDTMQYNFVFLPALRR